MITKQCTKCGRDLPLTEFHADKRRKYGVGSECRECKRKYRQENKDNLIIAQKERRKRQFTELSPKRKAWNALYYALRTGKIEKSDTCEVCGSKENIQGHHNDYNIPFGVIWCCQKCHAELDNQRRYINDKTLYLCTNTGV